MAEAAGTAGSRLAWQRARIEAIEPLAQGIKRVVLRPLVWHEPFAGQHIDVRLTAEDGYQAQRSYSLLSPPERSGVYELRIEYLAEGEVSPWFHEAAAAGDEIEILGPTGGHFIWRAQTGAPALLVGGGSGVVPLLAMMSHRTGHRGGAPLALCVAARTLAHVPMWAELQAWERDDERMRCMLALSRQTQGPRPRDRSGRLQTTDLAAALQWLGGHAAQSCTACLCGSNGFVESVTAMLRELRLPDGAIRTERFGG